jgi:hypothetical protein
VLRIPLAEQVISQHFFPAFGLINIIEYTGRFNGNEKNNK